MTVLLDANMLLLLLDPKLTGPIDPSTGKPVSHVNERVNYLVSELQRASAAGRPAGASMESHR